MKGGQDPAFDSATLKSRPRQGSKATGCSLARVSAAKVEQLHPQHPHSHLQTCLGTLPLLSLPFFGLQPLATQAPAGL